MTNFMDYIESGEKVPIGELYSIGLQVDPKMLQLYDEWKQDGNGTDFFGIQGRHENNTITLSLNKEGMAKVLCLHQDHPEYPVRASL